MCELLQSKLIEDISITLDEPQLVITEPILSHCDHNNAGCTKTIPLQYTPMPRGYQCITNKAYLLSSTVGSPFISSVPGIAAGGREAWCHDALIGDQAYHAMADFQGGDGTEPGPSSRNREGQRYTLFTVSFQRCFYQEKLMTCWFETFIDTR
jgi:hypothetical protein